MFPAMCPTVNTLNTVPEAAMASLRSELRVSPNMRRQASPATAAIPAVTDASAGAVAVRVVPVTGRSVEGCAAEFITEPS